MWESSGLELGSVHSAHCDHSRGWGPRVQGSEGRLQRTGLVLSGDDITGELILSGYGILNVFFFWLSNLLMSSLSILLRHHCLVLNADGKKASSQHPYMQGDNYIEYLCTATLFDHKTDLVARISE